MANTGGATGIVLNPFYAGCEDPVLAVSQDPVSMVAFRDLVSEVSSVLGRKPSPSCASDRLVERKESAPAS